MLIIILTYLIVYTLWLTVSVYISFQVNRLVTIILNNDDVKKYKYFKDKEELSWKTPLHLVAELNFTTVAQTILRHYPGQLYITTNPHAGNENRRCIPLELALMRHNDEVSALLMEHMKPERYSLCRTLLCYLIGMQCVQMVWPVEVHWQLSGHFLWFVSGFFRPSSPKFTVLILLAARDKNVAFLYLFCTYMTL